MSYADPPGKAIGNLYATRSSAVTSVTAAAARGCIMPVSKAAAIIAGLDRPLAARDRAASKKAKKREGEAETMASGITSTDVGPNHKIVLKAGRFDTTSKATREDLRKAFEHYRSTKPGVPLVIHFHGGLVSEASAEALASRLLPRYAEAGGYPLFVIWQTGMLEAIRNNWRRIVSADMFKGVLGRVLQFTVGRQRSRTGTRSRQLPLPDPALVRKQLERLGNNEEPFTGEAFAAGPANPDALRDTLSDTEEQQLQKLIQYDNRLLQAPGRLARGEADLEEDMLTPEVRKEVERVRRSATQGEKSALALGAMAFVAGKAIVATLRRFRDARDHGIYPTAVEETARALTGDWLGKTIWGEMKKNAADAFGDDQGKFGGTALLREIEAVCREDAGTKPPRIVLVGHSAGSIFICEALLAAERLDIDPSVRFEIVFLAPACTFSLLDRALHEAGRRVGWFRCFAMLDKHEQEDCMLDRLYPRSLLYFVSGALESEPDEPVVGMARFHGGNAPFDQNAYPAVAASLGFLKSHQEGWIWSVTDGAAGNGLGSRSVKHGDFDDDETTIRSVQHIIKGERPEFAASEWRPAPRAPEDAAGRAPGATDREPGNGEAWLAAAAGTRQASAAGTRAGSAPDA